MNRIYLLIVALFMMLASCSNSNDDVEQGENCNTNKESIVALWQDSDKKPENVVSFAKDGKVFDPVILLKYVQCITK